MQLEFFGAAGEVTGSCHILRVAGRELLLDCGMIQGGRDSPARNRLPFPFEPSAIDSVVLSHAHIDHCGRLPLLVKRGYRGPIYTNKACADLVPILLRDSANLAYARCESARNGSASSRCTTSTTSRPRWDCSSPFAYDTQRELLAGVTVRVRDAGHILGSSSVELWATEDGDPAQARVFRRSRPVRHAHPQGSLSRSNPPISCSWRAPTAIACTAAAKIPSASSAASSRRRRATAATSSCRRSPSAAARNCSIYWRSTTPSGASRAGRSSSTARWPSPPAACTGTTRTASTRKPRGCAQASAACRRCRISCCRNRRTTRAPSTTCAAARSSSPAPAWRTAAASCITSNTISSARNATWSSSASRRREHSGVSSSIAQPEVRIHGQRVRCLAQIHTLGGLSAHGDQERSAALV